MKNLIAILLTLTTSTVAFAGEAALTLATSTDKKIFLLSDLLKRNDLETIEVAKDPAYQGKPTTYQAVAAYKLFNQINIADDAVIQFKALDGFSAVLSKQRLLNSSSDQSIAYIALEPSDKKWPALKPGQPSAGPFYLIWKNPELSHIGTEEWPFMLAGFEVKGTLESLYPKIFPSVKIQKSSAIYKGFQGFVKNCFACHTMNKSGSSNMGPDLNLPMNPTEYFKMATLKKLIRNPQNLRHWPGSRMTAFDEKMLPESDLNNIIAYLGHMAKERP